MNQSSSDRRKFLKNASVLSGMYLFSGLQNTVRSEVILQPKPQPVYANRIKFAVINIDPPIVVFGVFVVYGFSGYVIYFLRKAKGVQTSVISTSTEEPEERGLHK